MLPKIEHPLFEIEVPSMHKKVRFRQILVREEKILTVAKQSGEMRDILLAVKQIVNNCYGEIGSFDVDALPIFDLEWIFVQLFALSSSSTIPATYQDNEDEKVRTFSIDLQKIQPPSLKGLNNNIKLPDNKHGIILGFPAASLYHDDFFMQKDVEPEDMIDYLTPKCIKKVYGEAETYEFSEGELKEFLDNLDIKTMNLIREYFMKIPQMRHEIEYVNDMGNQRKIVLSTLNDFFSWL